MKQEKVVLSFIAVVVGLLFAGVAFYLYQGTKTIPQSKLKSIGSSRLSPTPKPAVFLSVVEPADEEVFDKKVISISGKTTENAIVIISTDSDDQIVKPTGFGDFTTTINIEEGANLITIKAIAPNGEETTVQKTVSFSSEDF